MKTTALCVLVGIACGPVWGQTDSSATFGVSALDFTYKEFEDGSNAILDREDGWIPGLVFGVREAAGPWFGELEGSIHAGEVTYEGQTQGGVPATTDTEELIVDVAYRFGYQFGPRGRERFAPYAGIGYRWWNRDIQSGRDVNGDPVLGLEETYRWPYLLVGLEANLYRGRLSEFGMDVRLTRPVDPKMDIEAFSGYDDATLDLGEKTGGRAQVYWRYRYARDTALVVAPFYEQWDIGRSPDTIATSNGAPAAVVFEPRSETRNYGVSLVVRRSF